MRRLITPRSTLKEAAFNRGGMYRGTLAEDYDGIGQYVLVALAGSSVASAYKARVAVGDFGGRRVIPRGTPVAVASHRGNLEVFLGNRPQKCYFETFSRESVPGDGWGISELNGQQYQHADFRIAGRTINNATIRDGKGHFNTPGDGTSPAIAYLVDENLYEIPVEITFDIGYDVEMDTWTAPSGYDPRNPFGSVPFAIGYTNIYCTVGRSGSISINAFQQTGIFQTYSYLMDGQWDAVWAPGFDGSEAWPNSEPILRVKFRIERQQAMVKRWHRDIEEPEGWECIVHRNWFEGSELMDYFINAGDFSWFSGHFPVGVYYDNIKICPRQPDTEWVITPTGSPVTIDSLNGFHHHDTDTFETESVYNAADPLFEDSFQVTYRIFFSKVSGAVDWIEHSLNISNNKTFLQVNPALNTAGFGYIDLQNEEVQKDDWKSGWYTVKAAVWHKGFTMMSFLKMWHDSESEPYWQVISSNSNNWNHTSAAGNTNINLSVISDPGPATFQVADFQVSAIDESIWQG